MYARNIAGGANTVTATIGNSFTSLGILYIQEYTGLDPTSPFDVSVTGSGSSAAMNSGSASIKYANDLLFAAGASDQGVTQAGANYTIRSTDFGNIITRIGSPGQPVCTIQRRRKTEAVG